MKPLSRPVARMTALALPVLVLSAAWTLVIQPGADYLAGLRRGLAEAHELLGRYARSGPLVDRLRADIADLRRGDGDARIVMTSATPQLAAAEIQQRVKRLVEAGGSVLKSTQIMPIREESGFRRVSLRIVMESGVDGAQQVFYGLESAVPYLLLGNVDIRSRMQANAKNPDRRLPDLTVAFDVYGYVRAAP
jgi:general secretion pathway protein M